MSWTWGCLKIKPKNFQETKCGFFDANDFYSNPYPFTRKFAPYLHAADFSSVDLVIRVWEKESVMSLIDLFVG